MTEQAGELHFFTSGKEFYPALEAAILRAREEILINVFVFHNDRVGQRFLSLLEQKAREGVTVRLIFDGVWSLGDQKEIVRRLRRAGGQVRRFRPLPFLWQHPVSFTRRNHARIFSIDRTLLGLGGMSIGETYLDREDLSVLIQGPVPSPLLGFFDHLWEKARSDDGMTQRVFPPASARGGSAFGGEAVRGASLVFSGPHREDREVYRWLIRECGRARERITIVSPWFFPPQALLEALTGASERGVRVTVVTPFRSRWMFYDSFRAFPINFFLEGGGLWYRIPRSFHQKVSLVDDAWCFGSANCDMLGLKRNYELNLAGNGGEVLALLEHQTAGLIGNHRPVPVPSLSFMRRECAKATYRFLEAFLTPFRRSARDA